MSHPVSQLATRIAYLLRQLPRMAWYAGHLYVMRRLADELRRRESKDAQPKPRPLPGVQRRLDADMAALLAEDLANVEAGIYPLPSDHDGSLVTCWTARGCSFAICPPSKHAESVTARARS